VTLADPRAVPAWIRYAPLALAGAILVWHAQQYDFVTDDAFISFVFSRNFAEHGQLAFNLGDPVEGYTNFLWTFGLGVLMFLGIPPEIAARVLGIGFGLGVLVVTFRIGERVLGRGHPLTDLAPILLACSSGFACWSSGGLETQLYTFLVVLALDGYLAACDGDDVRGLRRLAIALALAAMTRPEGPLLAALFGVHRVASNLIAERRLRPSRAEWLAVAWFLGLWAPWFAWRWWYYGWPFPNTYYVKAAGAAVPWLRRDHAQQWRATTSDAGSSRSAWCSRRRRR
jgi:arabinofuranosyltransferase